VFDNNKMNHNNGEFEVYWIRMAQVKDISWPFGNTVKNFQAQQL